MEQSANRKLQTPKVLPSKSLRG